ncbi:MAG: IS5 family transposase [Flavitalea sp.]
MSYKTDISDKEWNAIKKDFEPANKRGNVHKHDKKCIVNAILYIVKDGIQWRLMPKDFPPWQTAHDHFSKWNKGDVWEKFPARLTAHHRQKAERTTHHRYGIIDAQSVKTQYASEDRGIDDGKKVKGHKRHIVVDILGNLLYAKAHVANLSDTKSACEVLEGTVGKYPSLKACSGDAGYRGRPARQDFSRNWDG